MFEHHPNGESTSRDCLYKQQLLLCLMDNLWNADGRKKSKRRLPLWAQDELKKTAKRVREERSELHERDQQPQPQVGNLSPKNYIVGYTGRTFLWDTPKSTLDRFCTGTDIASHAESQPTSRTPKSGAGGGKGGLYGGCFEIVLRLYAATLARGVNLIVHVRPNNSDLQ